VDAACAVATRGDGTKRQRVKVAMPAGIRMHFPSLSLSLSSSSFPSPLPHLCWYMRHQNAQNRHAPRRCVRIVACLDALLEMPPPPSPPHHRRDLSTQNDPAAIASPLDGLSVWSERALSQPQTVTPEWLAVLWPQRGGLSGQNRRECSALAHIGSRTRESLSPPRTRP